MSMLMTYSAPLTMVIESISRLTEFLETITVYPLDNGVGAFAKHRNRSWDLRHSYRIARGGVSCCFAVMIAPYQANLNGTGGGRGWLACCVTASARLASLVSDCRRAAAV